MCCEFLLESPCRDDSNRNPQHIILWVNYGNNGKILSLPYIYILIALALDESIILDVPQFPMQNIYLPCDLGRALGRSNVNASQFCCLFTDVCVTLITYRHDVKRGYLASWLFRNLRYVRFNSKYRQNRSSCVKIEK